MSFDKHWFGTLATLTKEKLDHIVTRPRRVPAVEDLLQEDVVGNDFAELLDLLVRELNERGHQLGTRIRVEPQHVYTYPQGTAYERQKNIGLYGTSPGRLRIGIGFRLEESNSEIALKQLEAFRKPIVENPQGFNELHNCLGGYHELMDDGWYPPDVDTERPSDKFTQRRPGSGGDWMFYGAQLHCKDPAHRWILADISRVAEFAAEVFEVIERTPFG
jgi:hypothetical protein